MAVTSAVALSAVSCDSRSDHTDLPTTGDSGGGTSESDGTEHAVKLAKQPFFIGSPGRYGRPGVYREHEDKGVWLVSTGHTLIAISRMCTHLACTTEFDQDGQCFICPCHKSQFDLEGVQMAGSRAKRPLERCALRLVHGRIEVDPTRRFRRASGQWSDPAASLHIS